MRAALSRAAETLRSLGARGGFVEPRVIAGDAAGSVSAPSLCVAFGARRRFCTRCGAAEISRLFLTAARRLYNCGAKIYFCEVQR